MSITCFEEIGKLKLKIGERKCSQFLVVKIDIFAMTLFTLQIQKISFGAEFADSDKWSKMILSVCWNSHLIELFCFKLFSNGSTRG